MGGATGTGKTLIAGIKMMDEINNLPPERTQVFYIFKDKQTGARNVLENKKSFYNMFPFLFSEYKESKTIGLHFKFYGLHGSKDIYILRGDDKASWSKVLGSEPDYIILEEVSELHDDCVRECIGRAISRGCKLIGTTNGGLPTQAFYTEQLNHAVVQFKDMVPAVELAEMEQFKPNGKVKPYMHYYHFNLNDDAPHMSEEQRNNLVELYPVGSFYHNSKVLGCRGFIEGAAYAQLMDRGIHLRDYGDTNLNYLDEIILSVDMGSNQDINNTSSASTIAKLVGFSKEYQRIITLERWLIPAHSHDHIIKEVEKLAEQYWVRYMEKFKKIVVDNADGIIVRTWQTKTKFPNMTIKAAVKFSKGEGGINRVSRCEFKKQLIKQGRLLWSDRASSCYNAHTRILVDEDGAELDLNIQDNDDGDSLTYAITENWAKLVQQDRRRDA